MTVTSRERVRTALSHRQPDRLPVDFGGTFLTSATPAMQRRIAELLGLGGEPDPLFDNFDDRIQKYFGCDLRSLTPSRGANWGVDWAHLQFNRLKEATIADLDAYPWPQPDDAMIAGAVERAQAMAKSGYFICASQIGQGIFEASCYLRGYEQTLMDAATDEAFVHAFNQKVLATNRRLGELWFGAIGRYVDMVLVGDDLATQNGPYLSVEMFRRLYKPYFAQYIADIRRHCPHAFIAHHCCGSSFMLLDELAEIGVQVINPVQTTAAGMSVQNLARKKDKLSFLGGVDLQHVLPFGTQQEVRDFVKNLIRELAPGGGYILAACHSLPDDVRPENVVTMLETATSSQRG
jgi:uroporphyrinogen decarboxylase